MIQVSAASSDDRFPYGASYSPLVFPESQWVQDLRRMRAAHINLVRIGDVHGSWDRIEPRRGEMRLDVLGRFYRLAAEYDVRVLLSNGTACPPLWLETLYPDVRIVSSRGERYPHAASYHWACIHHPGYVEEARRYTAALADFAAAQPNHFGWQISNEMGFPFMPARQVDELGLYCYCNHCKARFRAWLRAKYGTLEALSEAWMWSTTGFWYNDWAEVEPPEALPYAWSGVTRWIDWRLFWQDAFADFARWQHELIQAHDPHHPTSVNTFAFKSFDRFGTFMGLDQWKIAAQVNHIGYDLYPGSGDKLRTRPEHNSMFLDHGRSVSRSVGSDFWLHEVESGPIGGWVLGPDHNTGSEDILRNGMEALGHGAKLMIYMPWREWLYQPLHWGALVDLEGRETARYVAAAELGSLLERYAGLLRRAHVPQGEVALLDSKPNAIFFRGIEKEDVLFQAQRGAYRAFWEAGFRVDFVTPSQVTKGRLQGYRVVVLPLLSLMEVPVATALAEFAAQGGLVVGFARCGALDGRGWYHPRVPIPALGDLFGLDTIVPDDQPGGAVHCAEDVYPATLKRDLIEPRSESEVWATFADGRPAVTCHAWGDGYGLYIATAADVGYITDERPLLGQLVTALDERLGLRPELQVVYPGRRARELDAHLLHSEDRSLIIFATYLHRDVPVTVWLDTGGKDPRGVTWLWPEEAACPWSMVSDRLRLDVSVRAGKGGVLAINWK